MIHPEPQDIALLTATDCGVEERAAALEKHNQELARRDGLLRGAAEASRLLLAGTDLNVAMSTAVAALGKYTGCQRVAVFRYDHAGDSGAWWVEAIWEAPDVPSMLGVHGAGPLCRRDFPQTSALHEAGKPWICRTRDLPPISRCYNEAIGTLSNAKMPVHVDDGYWGFVSFSDCTGERDWSAGEVHVLEGVAAALGAAIGRAKREAEHREALAAERERAAHERAAQLAKANEALRLSSEQMCSLERLDVFLSHVLGSCLELSGAAGGEFRIAGERLHVAAAPQRGGTPSRTVTIPLVTRYHTLGQLELTFQEPHQPTEAQLEVVQVLVRQAALAVQLTRLAEDARETAVARERERAAIERASALAKANEALSRSVARLASSGELRDFLLGVLHESLQMSGAVSGGVVLHDRSSGTLQPLVAVIRGETIDLTRDHLAGPFSDPIEASGSLWESVEKDKRVAWIDYDDPGAHEWPQFKQFHDEHSHRFAAAIPMVLNNEAVGFLGLAFDRSETQLPSDLKLELCRTLAQQATLAVRLSHLAEEAKQAAIAKEQERLAESRATELTRAAAALRRTGGRLAGTLSLTPFVLEVLNEATRHTNAATSALFRYDAATEKLSVAAVVDEGIVVNLDSEHRFQPAAEVIPCWAKGGWERLADGEPVLTTGTDPQSTVITAVHRTIGHQHTLAVPVLIGSRVIAVLGLGFDSAPPNTCKIELLQALAQQTAVAIHLTELAERSRQTAVLQERASFARELHDTLLQGFTGVTLQLRALIRRPPEDMDTLHRTLGRIERESTDAVQEARRAVGQMRAGALSSESSAEEDLVGQLATVIEQAQASTEAQLIWQVTGRPEDLPPMVTTSVLRIAREAVNNALRHGQPRSVWVTLGFEQRRLLLTVEDDGIGFAVDPAALPQNGHFGLVGMRERTASIGGRIEVTSQSGMGTRIRVEVPL